MIQIQEAMKLAMKKGYGSAGDIAYAKSGVIVKEKSNGSQKRCLRMKRLSSYAVMCGNERKY
jgi:hypothetical protein